MQTTGNCINLLATKAIAFFVKSSLELPAIFFPKTIDCIASDMVANSQAMCGWYYTRTLYSWHCSDLTL